MSEATHNLSTSIGDVISKVSSVTNAVSFLYTDILEVSSDLSLNDALEIIQIAVGVAITELRTLQTDAS